MLEQDYISQKQYDEALADDVYARIQTTILLLRQIIPIVILLMHLPSKLFRI